MWRCHCQWQWLTLSISIEFMNPTITEVYTLTGTGSLGYAYHDALYRDVATGMALLVGGQSRSPSS